MKSEYSSPPTTPASSPTMRTTRFAVTRLPPWRRRSPDRVDAAYEFMDEYGGSKDKQSKRTGSRPRYESVQYGTASGHQGTPGDHRRWNGVVKTPRRGLTGSALWVHLGGGPGRARGLGLGLLGLLGLLGGLLLLGDRRRRVRDLHLVLVVEGDHDGIARLVLE